MVLRVTICKSRDNIHHKIIGLYFLLILLKNIVLLFIMILKRILYLIALNTIVEENIPQQNLHYVVSRILSFFAKVIKYIRIIQEKS